MTAAGESIAWPSDDDLCTATYPGGDTNPFDFGQLCDQAAGHSGNHRALAEVAFNYRRHVVWAVAGEVLPDEQTTTDSPRVTSAGQTPPTDGDQMT